MEQRSDGDLVNEARKGDKEAFGRLVERHAGAARHAARRMVDDDEIVHELVQEALIQAYLSLAQLRQPERFKSWLYGIVLNVCRSYLRDQKAIVFSLEAAAGGLRFDTIPFAAPDPQLGVEARDVQGRVREAVDALSVKNREAALLFYYEQRSVQEIAAITRVSEVAVKGRLHKARRQLRRWLAPLYAEMNGGVPPQGGRVKMHRATVADVVNHENSGHYVVVLMEESGRRALPIWVGPWEGQAIAAGLREFPTSRPMTFTFMAQLLEGIGAQVEEVRVEALQGDTFYGVVKLRRDDTVREQDARPSDAIALALRTGAPLYVAAEVLAKAGLDVPEGRAAAGRGLDAIAGEWAEAAQKGLQPRLETTKEERDRACDDLIASVFEQASMS